jgi:hypothetical protein
MTQAPSAPPSNGSGETLQPEVTSKADD